MDMAIDSYMAFYGYDGSWMLSESQVDFSKNSEPLMGAQPTPFPKTNGQIFEVEDFSFDIEQTLNIGSQSSGAGAGKVTFNPFSITRKIDKASPIFFQMACSGTAFKQVTLGLRKSAGTGGDGGGNVSGVMFLRFDFKLVAVKTISWSHDDESPKEEVTFEYGGLQVRYNQQDPSGAMKTIYAGGWNRVRNVQDTTADSITMVT
jgi:type VI secretion system secreted protein Hcp